MPRIAGKGPLIMLSIRNTLLVFLLFPYALIAQVQAARSYDFSNSVGVNTHWYFDNNFQYQPHFATLVSLMQQAGIYHFRDGEFAQGYNTPAWITAKYAQLAASGMRAELIVANGQTLSELESGLKAYPGLEAIEPPNEWDANGGAGWASTLIAQMPLLKEAGTDLGLPVLGPSLIQSSSAVQLGDIAQSINFSSIHPYSGGRNPETTGWGSFDAQGNAYGSLAWNLDMVRLYGLGRAAYATETGYLTTSTPIKNEVPELVEGVYAPRLLLCYFKSGIAKTYLYELIDDPAGTQPGYGLLRFDLSPKPAFTAIGNLLNLLKDANTRFTPASLDYSFSGDTNGVQSVLLQKSNGDFYLNVWLDGSIYDVNNLVATPQTPKELTLTVPSGKTVAGVSAFNPDGTMTQSAPNQSTLKVKVNSCVTTIRIANILPPPAPPAPAPTPVAATPTFSIAAGSYASAQSVALADSTAGAQIYFTTDNLTPTTASQKYSGAITVSRSETIRAMAVTTGYTQSPASSASYTIAAPASAADYSIAVTPGTITVLPGQSGAATINIDLQNGFSSTVNFACSGLPADASCSFSPASFTPASSMAQNVQLFVATSKTSAGIDPESKMIGTKIPAAVFAAVFCCIGFRKRKLLPLLCLAATAAFEAIALAGCGGASTQATNVASKLVTSTITVTATSGSLQHTATFSLTAQ